jgi:hypothetical protein
MLFMRFLYVPLFMFLFLEAKAQGFGLSVSYSTPNAFGIGMLFSKEQNRFHIGYTHQFNGQKSTVVTERKENYGLTKIESGDYFWLLDLGYSRIIKEKLSVYPEISFGSKRHFTSYRDDRFSDGGYSLIEYGDIKAGVGLNIGWFIHPNIETYLGYNTIKKASFGLIFSING